MNTTTWRVTQVTERPDGVEAQLQRVEWFRKNPDFDAAMADESVAELPTEFLDAEPGEDGADTIEVGGKLTLDITDGPELHPLDDVVLSSGSPWPTCSHHSRIRSAWTTQRRDQVRLHALPFREIAPAEVLR